MAELNRWELHEFDAVKHNIIVLDKLSKREKYYHVPNATHAILKESTIYVSILDNKVMKVCLHNGSRKIVGMEVIKNLNLKFF